MTALSFTLAGLVLQCRKEDEQPRSKPCLLYSFPLLLTVLNTIYIYCMYSCTLT